MREVKIYKCDICNTEYKSKIECEECERNHKTKGKIVKKFYYPKSINESGYPQRIKVEFEDKSTRIYELTGKVTL